MAEPQGPSFPFEVLSRHLGRAVTVDAYPTAHRLLLLTKAIGAVRWRGRWSLTHGPTGAALVYSNDPDKLLECARAARAADPTEELLNFQIPESLIRDCHDEEVRHRVPLPAWNVLRAARAAIGLATRPHPSEETPR